MIAASTSANVQSIAVQDDSTIRMGNTAGGSYTNIEADGTMAFIGEAVVWDDLKFPFTGVGLDDTSGRIDYDYFNCSIGFQANARYPEEPICALCQMPHKWNEGTYIVPHIHWIQQAADVPNWLLAYKINPLGEAISVETDYSNYTLLTSSTVFTYVSGGLFQISSFGNIDMTGYQISDCIQFVIFRDSANASGQFAGADPSALVEHVVEFDVHYQVHTVGSRQEYIK